MLAATPNCHGQTCSLPPLAPVRPAELAHASELHGFLPLGLCRAGEAVAAKGTRAFRRQAAG